MTGRRALGGLSCAASSPRCASRHRALTPPVRAGTAVDAGCTANFIELTPIIEWQAAQGGSGRGADARATRGELLRAEQAPECVDPKIVDHGYVAGVMTS